MWNKGKLDSNLQPLEKIKITIKVNTWEIIKSSITVIAVSNSTFFFTSLFKFFV